MTSTYQKENILKEAFEVECEHGAFFTGGTVIWSDDGEQMFCLNRSTVSVVNVIKGTIIRHIGNSGSKEDEEDVINTFTVNSDTVITQHKSSLFKLWNWKEGTLLKLWKSIHKGPVTRIEFQGDALMSSGGSDGSVRLWDVEHNACTHNLTGVQGVVSVLAFHPDSKKELIFAAGDDSVINAWNTKKGKNLLKLKGHFSKVTALSFHDDGVHLVSSGRDKVLILWELKKGTSLRILPIYENVEGVFLIPNTSSLPGIERNDEFILAASAGEKGVVQIWEMKSGRKMYEQTTSLVPPAKEEGGLSVTHLLFNKSSNSCAMVSTDHNIIIHDLDTFSCKKQLVGYSDEILDVAFLGDGDTHLAVATNSPDIKFYELATMNCQLLCGHANLILSLATTRADRDLLVSSDKDSVVRVWYLNKQSGTMKCIGIGAGHTAAVGSVSLSHATATFFVSASQDLCIKLWDLPEKFDRVEKATLNATHTVVAHQKDINCVTVSPNDKLVATGSQDKTAKLWSADKLQLLGVFRGHKRGVWCVRFSPVDQVLITTSADCTIKLWSLGELSCLKTMEGHESSVMRAEFLSRGMQLITTGGDGLLKLWSVKNSECIATLDKHDSRVWALAVNKKETHIVSGGSDSMLIVWRDVTQEKRDNAIKEKEQLALEEQKLANLLKDEKLTAALNLALKLDRPFHAYRIIEGIIKRGKDELIDTIRELKPARQEALLKFTETWNTNSRHAQVAQLVLNALMSEIDVEYLRGMGLKAIAPSLEAYTGRHFQRLTRQLQDLHLLNYVVNQMKPHFVPAPMDRD